MKKVDRNIVPFPLRLKTINQNDYDKVVNSGKATPSIYAHHDVTSSLSLLYSDKCYICEKDISSSSDIEHYLPVDSKYPERAYDWKNLHLSCRECNHKKKKNTFKIFDGKSVIQMLIIDPSNTYDGLPIETFFCFNKRKMAIPTTRFACDLIVQRTVELINSNDILYQRKDRWDELTEVVLNFGCIDIWKLLISSNRHASTNCTHPYNSEELDAIDNADRIYSQFLQHNTPYSSCMRQCFFHVLKISAEEIKTMSDSFRQTKGQPLLPD